jgi:hypothetical protein
MKSNCLRPANRSRQGQEAQPCLSVKSTSLWRWLAVCCAALLLLAVPQLQGALYSSGNVNGSGTSLNLAVADGNPNGVFTTMTVSGSARSLSDLSVTLNVSGGYNGDLYAYVSYGGVLVPLLNRVGVGSSDAFGSANSGFHNVTLFSTGTDVHNAGYVNGPLTGSWQVDGRTISPLSSPSSFDTASRATFSGYNGLDPNGTWTLFVADMSSGGGVSVLDGWSLDVTAVPEQAGTALSIFGVAVAVLRLLSCRRRKHGHRPSGP